MKQLKLVEPTARNVQAFLVKQWGCEAVPSNLYIPAPGITYISRSVYANKSQAAAILKSFLAKGWKKVSYSTDMMIEYRNGYNWVTMTFTPGVIWMKSPK